MSINVRVNTGNLQARAQQAARRASEIVMGELFAAFQQSFTANAWDWPRETTRGQYTYKGRGKKRRRVRSGEGGFTVGSPRNLIDTGNLRQTGSYQMTGPYQATFRWSANYATAVHEGAYIYPWGNRDADRVYLPPRPWTRAVLGQEDAPGVKPYNLGDRLQNVWLAQFRRR
jgi:hypothetical protein